MSEERRYTLIPGDVLDFCREYEGEKFHAALEEITAESEDEEEEAVEPQGVLF